MKPLQGPQMHSPPSQSLILSDYFSSQSIDLDATRLSTFSQAREYTAMAATRAVALSVPRPRSPAACPPRSPVVSHNRMHSGPTMTPGVASLSGQQLREVRANRSTMTSVRTTCAFGRTASYPRLRTDGARALGAALRTNTVVDELDLTSQGLGDEGISALVLALGSNQRPTAVRRLRLRNNGIGDQGAAALAEFMISSMTLVELDIRDNLIGDIGARELACALSRSDSIRRFDLRGNRTRDDGSLAVTEALRLNPRLRKQPCVIEYD